MFLFTFSVQIQIYLNCWLDVFPILIIATTLPQNSIFPLFLCKNAILLISGLMDNNIQVVAVGPGYMHADIFPNASQPYKYNIVTNFFFSSADSGKPCRRVKYNVRGFDNTAKSWMKTTIPPTMVTATALADMFRVCSWARSIALTCLPVSKHFLSLLLCLECLARPETNIVIYG